MAYTTTAGTLIDRTRRFIFDVPDFDALTASLSSTTTSVNVADTTLYSKRLPIEVGYETMLIRSISSATTLVVLRGAFGSTATTHSSGDSVLIKPGFFGQEILDALNQALMSAFPYLYIPVQDTSLTTTDATYEYTLPSMPGTYSGQTIQIPWVYKVELKYTGDLTYRTLNRWWIEDGPTGSRLLKFRAAEPAGATVRVSGIGPFPALSATSTVLEASFPPNAEYVLPMLAASFLLMSGEAARDRFDTAATDRREEANRAGASLNTAMQLYARAQAELLKAAKPPKPRHVRAVL